MDSPYRCIHVCGVLLGGFEGLGISSCSWVGFSTENKYKAKSAKKKGIWGSLRKPVSRVLSQ
jgi:hypothetical protein